MRSACLLAALALAACSSEDSPAATPPSKAKPTAEGRSSPFEFSDHTQASGLAFVHDAGLSEQKQLPETMGAGAALADFNEDGHLDLYLVQSGPLPLGGERSAASANELWLGDGAGNFRLGQSEVGAGAHRGYGMGVACGDYDGDGHLDLYVTNLGPDVLLRGDGRGGFSDQTQSSGIADDRWTAGATFFDADGDGDLDLYVSAYLDYDLGKPVYCGDQKPGWRSYCHPDRYPGIQDRFWRNRGDGSFENATEAAGLGDSYGKGLGACASDFDGDGDLDLYVANDSVENRMWINRGDGSFEDGTLLAGTGVNGMGLTEAGMGIATGDLNEDGRIDLYVTNFDDESNTFYRNDGDGFFTDATATSGLEAPSRLPVGFGVVAADLDDDGDLDLAVANGHIIDNIHLYNDGKSWAQPALLFENLSKGRFRDASAESGDLARTARVGRGLYAGDLDHDGDVDLIATENNGSARVLINAGSNSTGVELWGLPAGSRVHFELEDGRVLLREAGPMISYFGASATPARCGPGGVQRIRLSTPDGRSAASIDLPEGGLAPGSYRVRLDQDRLELELVTVEQR